jgi:hypothetical protein
MLTTSLIVASLLIAFVIFLRARTQAKRLRTRVKENIRKRDVFRVWMKQVCSLSLQQRIVSAHVGAFSSSLSSFFAVRGLPLVTPRFPLPAPRLLARSTLSACHFLFLKPPASLAPPYPPSHLRPLSRLSPQAASRVGLGKMKDRLRQRRQRRSLKHLIAKRLLKIANGPQTGNRLKPQEPDTEMLEPMAAYSNDDIPPEMRYGFELFFFLYL